MPDTNILNANTLTFSTKSNNLNLTEMDDILNYFRYLISEKHNLLINIMNFTGTRHNINNFCEYTFMENNPKIFMLPANCMMEINKQHTLPDIEF